MSSRGRTKRRIDVVSATRDLLFLLPQVAAGLWPVVSKRPVGKLPYVGRKMLIPCPEIGYSIMIHSFVDRPA